MGTLERLASGGISRTKIIVGLSAWPRTYSNSTPTADKEANRKKGSNWFEGTAKRLQSERISFQQVFCVVVFFLQTPTKI